MSTNSTRVAILTGGGDCPGLNAVIRSFVKTADNQFAWEVLGIRDGFEGLLRRDDPLMLDADNVRGLIARGGTILGTTNRADPFHVKEVVKGSVDGGVVEVDRSADALDQLHRLGADCLVVIGGDGSLRIGLGLHRAGFPVIGVPKTIDNDLSATDITFGFHSAVQIVSDAIDRLRSTAESHHRVMVVEVMGRNAGWIALEAGVAGGADVILIPEIPFDVGRVAECIKERDRRGKTFSIVVASEGAAPRGGAALYLSQSDPLAPKRLGGIGYWLAEALHHHIRHEIRVTVLGHLQRGGTPTAFDRILATRLGSAAAWMVRERAFGYMPAVRGTEIVPVPLGAACLQPKLVPPSCELVQTARAIGTSFGD